MDRAAIWRAEQGGTGSFQGREGIARPWGGHTLADDDGPGPGPGVEHPRIRGLAAVVRGQHQVNRLGLRLGDQLDKTQLIKVAGEQKVPAPHAQCQAPGCGRCPGFRGASLVADGAP